MTRHELSEKHFNSIMELKGADELKATVKRLHIFLENKETHLLNDITLPNHLWVIKRGGGVSTLVKFFTEYLYAARAIDFCGTVKSFEFKLDYIAPDAFFSELTRLDNTISGLAGHHRQYKGVVCVNIDEWLEHTSEVHFSNFLDYIASNNDRLLVIFYTHNESKNIIDAAETALSSHLRVEMLSLRFPDATELIDFVEAKHIKSRGFSFTEDARTLLYESIVELAAGKHFKGFKSVEQLANDILYSVLSSDLGENKKITANMIIGYGKDSIYVKRAKAQIGIRKVIGFAERSV